MVEGKEEAQRWCSLLDASQPLSSLFGPHPQAHCPSPSCSHLPTNLGAWAMSRDLLESIWTWAASLTGTWNQTGLPVKKETHQASSLPSSEAPHLLCPSDLKAKLLSTPYSLTIEPQKYPDIQVIKPGAIGCYPSGQELVYWLLIYFGNK